VNLVGEHAEELTLVQAQGPEEREDGESHFDFTKIIRFVVSN
jgi:hypothetical protein